VPDIGEVRHRSDPLRQPLHRPAFHLHAAPALTAGQVVMHAGTALAAERLAAGVADGIDAALLAERLQVTGDGGQADVLALAPQLGVDLLGAAEAGQAVPRGLARPPKANTTDLASRVMPLKKGGSDQLYNLKALAGRGQVIFAIGTHDSIGDTAALQPLLAAAGVPDTIGKALFDAGYASEDNFSCRSR
jgi:hypothetical protein